MPLRIYADTSVFGGMFDVEFQRPTRVFFEQVRDGRFHLVSSTLVLDELSEAPRKVQGFFNEMASVAEVTDVPPDSIVLRDAYLKAGIVGAASLADAQHVAIATVLACVTIVSWNFRHIVHFQKVPLYNGVNRVQGYPEIGIYTPQEVIGYEE